MARLRWIIEECRNGWLVKDTADFGKDNQSVFLTIDDVCAYITRESIPKRAPKEEKNDGHNL